MVVAAIKGKETPGMRTENVDWLRSHGESLLKTYRGPERWVSWYGGLTEDGPHRPYVSMLGP